MTTPPAPGQQPSVASRVVLYVRQGCHLCEEARAVLAGPLADVVGPGGWTEVDVDAGGSGAGEDPTALVARYGDLLPVVEVDGVQQCFWRVDADRVRRALLLGQGSDRP